MTNAENAKPQADANWKIEKGRINRSVVSWCFNLMPVEALAKAAATMGLKSVELYDPKHWPMLKSFGLTCAIASTDQRHRSRSRLRLSERDYVLLFFSARPKPAESLILRHSRP